MTIRVGRYVSFDVSYITIYWFTLKIGLDSFEASISSDLPYWLNNQIWHLSFWCAHFYRRFYLVRVYYPANMQRSNIVKHSLIF